MIKFDITSIGRIAGQVQMPTRQITTVAKQLGIEPSATINGIAHYSQPDVELIAQHVRATATEAPQC